MNNKETTIERMVMIDAPASVIWKALEEDGLSSLQLLRSGGDAQWREGRTFEWFDREGADPSPRVKARITIISPPRHIAFMAFLPACGLEDVPENYTAVDITLSPDDYGRTKVTVHHGDFANHPHGVRLAREAGENWVQTLIRLKHQVEQEAAA